MWWEFVLAVVIQVSVLVVSGGLVARALGLRGLWMLSSAPVIGVSLVGVAALLSPLLGVSWSVVPVFALAALVALPLWFLRRNFGTRVARSRTDHMAGLAFGVAAVIIGAQVLIVIGSPMNFSNTFDNVFHLNVVRFIWDTGNASSLWVGNLTDHTGRAGFYPAAWHDLVSLVGMHTEIPIQVAVNATTLVISAIIWPLGVILLTRQMFGVNAVVTIFAGLLSAAFPLFPLLMLDYGVLYPYQLGVAMLPVVIATTLRFVGLGKRRPSLRPWQWTLLLAGVMPGLIIAHPGAFVAWLALTVPIAVFLTARGLIRARGIGIRAAIIALFVVYLAAGLAALRILRPGTGREWPIEMRVREAVGEILAGSVWYGLPSVIGVGLVLVGLVFAIARQRPIAVMAMGMLGVTVVLYVVVASLPYPGVRDLLTGSWYNNRPRLAALLPVMAVPVGAYGAGALWAWARSRPLVRRFPRRVRRVIGVALVLLLCVLTQSPAISPVPRAVSWAAESYRTSPEARLISTDELDLLNRLPELVPADAVIVGSPWTGTALAYALADRKVVLPHMFTTTTAEEGLVLDSLSSATSGSPTCDAVHATGVTYVLWFGSQEIHGAHHVFPGLTNLDNSAALQLVAEEGQAKLYRVVGC